MNKVIAVLLAICTPVYLLAKFLTVVVEATHDSRLYALGMFVESFKFHWLEHDLTLKEYWQFIKDLWNDSDSID